MIQRATRCKVACFSSTQKSKILNLSFSLSTSTFDVHTSPSSLPPITDHAALLFSPLRRSTFDVGRSIFPPLPFASIRGSNLFCELRDARKESLNGSTDLPKRSPFSQLASRVSLPISSTDHCIACGHASLWLHRRRSSLALTPHSWHFIPAFQTSRPLWRLKIQAVPTSFPHEHTSHV